MTVLVSRCFQGDGIKEYPNGGSLFRQATTPIRQASTLGRAFLAIADYLVCGSWQNQLLSQIYRYIHTKQGTLK